MKRLKEPPSPAATVSAAACPSRRARGAPRYLRGYRDPGARLALGDPANWFLELSLNVLEPPPPLPFVSFHCIEPFEIEYCHVSKGARSRLPNLNEYALRSSRHRNWLVFDASQSQIEREESLQWKWWGGGSK